MDLYLYKATLVRVIDGDTIIADIDLGYRIVMRRHVRFYDVDTAEIYGAKKSPTGYIAKSFVEDMFMKHGPEFILKSHRDQDDRYSRALGTIYLKDVEQYVNLNETLKASGLDARRNDYVGQEPVIVHEAL